MHNFIINNMPNILVVGALTAWLIAVAVKIFRDKGRGISSCGCNCTSCPSKGTCHVKRQT